MSRTAQRFPSPGGGRGGGCRQRARESVCEWEGKRSRPSDAHTHTHTHTHILSLSLLCLPPSPLPPATRMSTLRLCLCQTLRVAQGAQKQGSEERKRRDSASAAPFLLLLRYCRHAHLIAGRRAPYTLQRPLRQCSVPNEQPRQHHADRENAQVRSGATRADTGRATIYMSSYTHTSKRGGSRHSARQRESMKTRHRDVKTRHRDARQRQSPSLKPTADLQPSPAAHNNVLPLTLHRRRDTHGPGGSTAWRAPRQSRRASWPAP